ncbi:Hsp70 family protein [Micromonospora sp. NPDC049559]|uniref:Hsp70 family protein n=1 Tax=Micromonospora sp. NPDC049559 TaxID=3155923 RepID=UPI00342BA951
MVEPARLAVDLGTTHTVAVVRRGDQPARPLLFDGSPLLPSGVFVDEAGATHTGRDAQRLGVLRPECFEPQPKRRIDEDAVLLGAREVPVSGLLAAVLGRVAGEARVAGVDPAAATVVTCPADWGGPRRERLREAARRAGLGEVRLVDEPIAAATYCLGVWGQRVPVGGVLGVFDFGGGTLDVAVVRREASGLRVLATGGLDDLGGVDVDEALVAHLGQLVGVRDPGLWERLRVPGSAAQRRDRQVFWAEVRAAKEMLSRAASAPVQVPGWDEPVHLTREELERVAGPLVARAVDETRRVVQRAGVEPAALAGLVLVGGSSRLPLVATRLHARLGVAPEVPEQPELPVAFGAVRFVAAPAGPVLPDAAAGRVGAGSPAAGAVSGGSPLSSAPVAPVAGIPVGAGAAVPPVAVRPSPGSARRRRPVRRALLASVAVLAVAGCVAALGTGGRLVAGVWDRLSGALPGGANLAGDGADVVGELTEVTSRDLPGSGAGGVTVAGGRVVSAVAGGGGTQVTSTAPGVAQPLWSVRVPVEPTELRLTGVGDLVVVDGEGSATDGGRDVRAVLSAADGRLLWKSAWEQRRDVAFYGTDVVVEGSGREGGPGLSRVDLRTGEARWSRAGDDAVLGSGGHRVEPLWQWPPLPPGAVAGVVPAAEVGLRDAVAAGGVVVQLDARTHRGSAVDVATGRPAGAGGALPVDEELWTAFDGLVVGKVSSRVEPGRDVLAGYGVSEGFARRWQLPLEAGRRVQRVKPCGPHLVCAAVDGRAEGDHATVAVDTRTGVQVWSAAVDWSDEESWYVAQGALVWGRAPFDSVERARVLGFDGGRLRQLPDGSSVVAVAGGRLVARRYDAYAGWRIWVEEVSSGRVTAGAKVGEKAPEQVVVDGDLVAVVTGDRRVLTLRAAGLA